MSDTPDWAAAARARCEAATPGPWADRKDSQHSGSVLVEENGQWVETVARVYCGAMKGHGPANAEFIAAARTDLPHALACVEAADRLVALLDEALDIVPGSDHWKWREEAHVALAAYKGARK